MPFDCSFAHERTLAFRTGAWLLFVRVLHHNHDRGCEQVDLEEIDSKGLRRTRIVLKLNSNQRRFQ